MVLTGCNDAEPCPKQQYPGLKAINKIPYYSYSVVGGRMDSNSTLKAFKTIKALRVSEHYYYRTILDYRKEFVK